MLKAGGGLLRLRHHCTSLPYFLQAARLPIKPRPSVRLVSHLHVLARLVSRTRIHTRVSAESSAPPRSLFLLAANYRPGPSKGNLHRAEYNRPVTSGIFSRRRFLVTAAGLAAAGFAPRRAFAPPTPTTPNPTTTEPREYFVPRDDYHELPPECYEPNLIRPLEIIVHWDGNRKGRALWLAPITFETLKYLQQSVHFAVDNRRVWQMLPMYRTVVQESHGAKGYNWEAINIEMAGLDFDLPENYPPESEIRLTVRLVSQLMDFYGIAFEHVVGHFERDPRGDKKDPGVKFMADFRERLKTYRASLSPIKRNRISD
jgi:hypothetical protein